MSELLNFNYPPEPAVDRVTLFADVILPLPLPKLYTYRIPFEMNDEVLVGVRVIVQFGAKRVLSCIVAEIHEQAPADYQAKYILDVLDDTPIVTVPQLKLFKWIADYYMCTLGEVINAALPSALKLSSESRIQLHPHFNPEEDDIPLAAQEAKIIYALQHNQAMTFTDIGNLLQVKSYHKYIKSLIQKEAIIIYEQVSDKFSPKVVKKIRLSEHFVQEEGMLEELFEQLTPRPKQLDILLNYLQKVPVHQDINLNYKGIEKSALTNNPHLSKSSIDSLVKKGVLEQFDQIISRFPVDDSPRQLPMNLSEHQLQAKDEILGLFKEKDTVLLHGVTGSGKTEVYIDLIKHALEGGGQVLYLLPEIALTAQIVTRLMKVFGEKLGVYHSKFSDNERAEVWQGVLSGRFQVVVGVRSAVFLPFHNLSLIIVDEEHEASYKQYEPAPRYNARETALMMAHLQGAKTLLGSATPAIETYYNCKTDRWGLVTMLKRFGEAQLPDVELVNTREEQQRKTMHSHFSSKLLDGIEARLKRKEQVILFQNRRGYAPFISCDECSWIPKCRNCAVSLSYHKFSGELRCHYCGYHERMPSDCPACGATTLKSMGFGTEKIEDDLKLMLPSAEVQRMDLDTTKKKNSYQQIIADFENGKTNVLVGTQMVTKGLDFENVSLVGILNADSIIHFPDFRAHERAFQLFVQVSGRAGRKGKPGTVIIQTRDPMQAIFRKVKSVDYEALYAHEIEERMRFSYPPFVRMIKVTVKHADERTSENAAIVLAKDLTDRLGKQHVLGPEIPYIFRIRNLFLNEIHIKLPRENVNLRTAKGQIAMAIQQLYQMPDFKGIRVVADVDPM
ncbi:primosomal protein N' [Pontibacter sp. BT310]|uniref:Replication restart protein PriA n=1 Tax=Pontibacter populi TaxID=890055 RepID=A0ABS6X804_9BACT|nr:MULTISPECIES: primosomal protein N' [Pontibacter]MBJ6116936.1 primosomal protein N' [Pontibacter sp. BT310]MBR0569360.1 primosomal protein N' [Microvirga sp. STS03]MBW3363789.1 primosomal protein N' [Pontibacter populi]